MLIRKIIRIHVWGLVFLLIGLSGEFLTPLPAPCNSWQSDIKVISNPKTPIPPAGKKKLVFREELSIGQKEGDENTMLGEAVSFNTDDEGNFYITEWDKKRILKFDQSGKYLLTIGSKGQGPGEFQNLSVARFDANGDVYVTDIAARRISFFDKKGSFLRQIRIPDVFEDLYITANGYYVSSHSVPLESDARMAFKIVDGFFNDKFELVTEFHARVVDTKLLDLFDEKGRYNCHKHTKYHQKPQIHQVSQILDHMNLVFLMFLV